MSQLKCPICGGAETPAQGFVLDHTYGAKLPAEWAEGEPRPSFWTGLKLGDQRRLQIEAWRCPTCGYLMLFADRPSLPGAG